MVKVTFYKLVTEVSAVVEQALTIILVIVSMRIISGMVKQGKEKILIRPTVIHSTYMVAMDITIHSMYLMIIYMELVAVADVIRIAVMPT